jgi:hypothetical protein
MNDFDRVRLGVVGSTPTRIIEDRNRTIRLLRLRINSALARIDSALADSASIDAVTLADAARILRAA